MDEKLIAKDRMKLDKLKFKVKQDLAGLDAEAKEVKPETRILQSRYPHRSNKPIW